MLTRGHQWPPSWTKFKIYTSTCWIYVQGTKQVVVTQVVKKLLNVLVQIANKMGLEGGKKKKKVVKKFPEIYRTKK
jgi:hypothetical protein